MLTFLIVLIVFSILIFVHELGHMLVAKRIGVRVERFSLGFGRKLFGFKKGDTEYVISIFPFGGYVKLAGEHLQESTGAPDEFQSKSIFKRFLVIVSGSLTNYIFAFLLFIAIFMIGMPSLGTKVGTLLPDYPAKKSGIRVGDHIVNIEGKNVKYWQDLVKIVQKSTDGKPLDFEVERNGRVLNFDIIPKIQETKNIFGQETRIGMIGISPKQEIIFIKHNFFQAIGLGSQKLWEITALTYKGLWLLITGGMPFKESVSGPIGIAVIIGEAAKAGFVSIIATMAYINVALAIFNLLPIPILDGGHVLFLLIEKLRGKPVSAKTQEVVSQVFLYLLLALVLFVSWNDITRFFIRR